MGKKAFVVPAIIVTAITVVTFLYWSNFNDNKRVLPENLQSARNHLVTQNYDSAILFAQTVINKAKNQNNIAYAENIIGYAWFYKGNMDSSYYHYANSIKASHKSDSVDLYVRANTYSNLGSVFEDLEIHEKAISYYKKSVEIYTELESPELAKQYYNIAFNQSKVNDIECVKSYYKALEVATQFENKYYEAICLNDLGILMLETSNYVAASEYFTMSLTSDYTMRDDEMKAFAHHGLGVAYVHLEELKNAKKELKIGIELYNKVNNKQFLLNAYRNLSKALAKEDNPQASEQALLKGIEYFSYASHTRDNIKVFQELSDIQYGLGKIKASNANKVRHYSEIEKYLDEKERASELAKKDQFDQTVAVQEAHYRNNSLFTHIKDELDWGLLVKLGCLLYFSFFLIVAERKLRWITVALA